MPRAGLDFSASDIEGLRKAAGFGQGGQGPVPVMAGNLKSTHERLALYRDRLLATLSRLEKLTSELSPSPTMAGAKSPSAESKTGLLAGISSTLDTIEDIETRIVDRVAFLEGAIG